jgi:MFS family permease
MCRPPTQDEIANEPSLARTFWRLRAVALVACCDEALFSFATGATHYPYLRTLVRCHARSSSFSGSARCGDADVVLQRGARLGGWATLAVVVGNVLCVLLWAPRIDSSGRRHTIVRSLVGLALGLLALACAAHLDSVALSLGAYVVMAATSATQAAAAALASDSMEKDARQRTALAVVGGARGAGTVAAAAAGYFVLRRDLEDYSIPYAACAALALGAAALARGALREVAPPQPTEGDWRRGARALFHNCRRAAAALSITTAAYYAGFSILSSWGISQLGLAQAMLSLVVLVQYAGLALGALTASLVGGAIAVAGGLVATGLAAPRAPLLVWALPPIAGLGLGAASTAASTEVGISVSQEDQGQAQAVLLLLGYVGAALGCLLGPRLYAPEASVLRASLPFLVGAGVAVATALGLVATAPRRVEGLEEALLEDGDDEDESEV